jgi:adenosylcobinamide amidohydrolase
LNAQVPEGYRRTDPDRHLQDLATACGLRGPGVGMLTAAQVGHRAHGQDGGVGVVATTGLGCRMLAASREQPQARLAGRPGTINLIAAIPATLEDGALLNALMTATEAKSQALIQAGFACTGTASDAVCVASMEAGPRAMFGGPRSQWGARLARAVHEAVLYGALDWIEHNPLALDDLQPIEAFSPARSFG